MRKLKIILSFLILFTLFSCGEKKESVNYLTLSEAEVRDIAQPVLTELFKNQFENLTKKNLGSDWKSQMDPGFQDPSKAKIENLRNVLEKIGFYYTDYTSKIFIDSIFKESDQIRLKIKNEYSLKTNLKDSSSESKFITTFGEVIYSFSFRFINNKLLISNYYSFEDPWYINLHPTVGKIDIQESKIKMLPAYNYNSNDAVTYAYNHWNNPNPSYCNYQDRGGDCTNFLSQCLLNGGWFPNQNWRAVGASCCDNILSCSIQNCYTCSWTVAEEFKRYVLDPSTHRIVLASFPDDTLQVGDILQLEQNPAHPGIDHSTIVTNSKYIGGTNYIFVTYRSAGSGTGGFRDKPSIQISGTHYGWKVLPNGQ